MSYYKSLGEQLKENLMAGLPTRTKSVADYTGISIPPCGDFAIRSSPTRPPWLQRSSADDVAGPRISLHQEILAFVQYMDPTPREIAIREDLVKRFTSLIASFNLSAIVRPVGSYVTGLYLPNSDIDMVLTFSHAYVHSTTRSQARMDLYAIYGKILHTDFASGIEDVLDASVPLLRITDKKTGIQIDLTAADEHGIKATKAVQKWLKKDERLVKALVLVVKIFLSMRKCGTTYTGGINSYLLFWMVVAWVNLEWKKKETKIEATATNSDLSTLEAALKAMSLVPGSARSAGVSRRSLHDPTANRVGQNKSEDFGEALKAFLKFYGSEFDYYHAAIIIEPTPSYTRSPYAIVQRYLLSIRDPADFTVDMGAKAYAIKHVKESFQSAYVTLNEANPSRTKSPLTRFFDGDFGKFVEKRTLPVPQLSWGPPEVQRRSRIRGVKASSQTYRKHAQHHAYIYHISHAGGVTRTNKKKAGLIGVQPIHRLDADHILEVQMLDHHLVDHGLQFRNLGDGLKTKIKNIMNGPANVVPVPAHINRGKGQLIKHALRGKPIVPKRDRDAYTRLTYPAARRTAQRLDKAFQEHGHFIPSFHEKLRNVMENANILKPGDPSPAASSGERTPSESSNLAEAGSDKGSSPHPD